MENYNFSTTLPLRSCDSYQVKYDMCAILISMRVLGDIFCVKPSFNAHCTVECETNDDQSFYFVSDCLLPGPMIYLKRIDALVTCNHACRAECYKYQVLASAQGDIGGAETTKTENARSGLTAIRTALVEWSINLGESCRQIIEGKFVKEEKLNSRELIFLCEQSIFLVKDTGGIMQMRRLEKYPMCIVAFTPESSTVSNFMVVNMDKSLQVFSDFTLVWAAMNPGSGLPVQIGVANIISQKGLIVTVDDEAVVRMSYLGTKPPVNAVATFSRDLDYDKIDEEHKKLLQVIRESQTESAQDQVSKLSLKAQLLPLNSRQDAEMISSVGTSDLPSDVVMMSHGFSSDFDGPLKASYKITVSAIGICQINA